MRLKLVICFMAVAAAAAAADQRAARLPDPVAMVVSTRSPMQFLQSLDGYLSTALAETQVGYQPGMLPFLSTMFLPPPLAAADLDAETHLIILAGGGSFGERAVVLASIGEYQQYLDAAAGGGKATEEENGIAVIAGPGGLSIHVAEAGAGKAVIADSRRNLLDALEVIKSWWPTGAADDGALEVTLSNLAAFDPAGNLLSLIEEADGEFGPFGDAAAESFAEHGFDGDVVKGFYRAIKKGVEFFGRELSGLAGGKVEFAAAGDNLSVRFFLTPGDDGFIGDIAGHAAALSNTVYPTTKAGDPSILCVSQIAPVQAIIPDHLAFSRGVTAAVLSETMPSLQDEVARWIGRYFDGGPGETVRFVVTHETIIDRIRADDPETVFEALTDSFRSFDKALELASGGHADKRARIAVSDETVGGTDIRRFRMVFDEGSVWSGDSEDSGDDVLRAIVRKMENLQYVMTRTDGHVVIVTTERSAEDAVKAIADLTGEAVPMVETPKAKAVLDAMRYRQIGFILLNPQRFIRLAIENVMATATQNLSEDDISMIKGVLDDMIASDEVFGFGNGVGPDGYAFEALFTAAGVNNIVKNYYLFNSRLEAMSGSDTDSEDDMDGEYKEGDGDPE